MENKDKQFMQAALEQAKIAYEKNEIPVGAVITNGDRIIARAHNLTELLNDVTAHAEMQAITSAADFIGGKYLTGCTIYVTLEPCTMCAGALSWSQISRIVYGANDKKRGYTTFAPNILNAKTKVNSGILEEECSELMKKFFKKLR